MDCPDSLVRYLIGTVRCSVCRASYRADDVSVLGHQDQLWFLTVTCASCRTQGLIAALVRDNVADTAPATEGGDSGPREAAYGKPCGPAEVAATNDAHARDAAPISEADVEDMRAFLEDFHGDMRALLGTG